MTRTKRKPAKPIVRRAKLITISKVKNSVHNLIWLIGFLSVANVFLGTVNSTISEFKFLKQNVVNLVIDK